MEGKILACFAALTMLCTSRLMTASGQQLVAGNNYPQGYFRNPLGIPFSLTANFGELRPNHWHMGLDLRTEQRENLSVYAAAEGFISSIGIRSLSFGRYIIVEHPNGYSTLYAHLNDFFPALEKYVSQQQREKESWAIELNFSKNQFPVRRGDLIGYSGNTGGSQGPHLHFEIRDTETGKVLNPLLFGFNISDNVPPVITRLALYNRGVSTYMQAPESFSLKKNKNGYTTTPARIKTPFKKISIAIGAHDKIGNSTTNDGIFGANLFFDDKSILKFEIDNIDYTESVFINARTDYKYTSSKGVHLQHLSRLPGDHAPVYREVLNDGVIEFTDTSEHHVCIQVLDAYKNVSELSFTIQYTGEPQLPATPPLTGTRFIPGYVSIIEKNDFELILQENCLYDTVALFYSYNETFAADAVSTVHRVNDPSIPVHCDFKIKIRPTARLTEWQKARTVMVREWQGKKTVKKVVWQQDWATSTFSDFGNFQLFTDNTAPELNSPAKERDTLDLSPINRIIFTPKDLFGIRSFRAELNGEWLKFSNDKGRSYNYSFDEQVPYGVHELKVKAEDIAGNITEKTWWFKRYPYTPPKKKISKKKSSKKTSKKRK